MNILYNNKGIAAILAILIISIIVVLTLEFNTSMREEFHASVNSKDGIMLGYIAKSGFNFALAVLSEDESDSDSLNDKWAILKNYSSYSNNLFDEGLFQVEVTDLQGRIQINQLINSGGEYNLKQKELLTRLLTSEEFDIEKEEAEDIIDNIKDWIDADDEVTRFGAESSYYQNLESPCSCRNGPIRSIEEMLLIKGITKELMFGEKGNSGLSRYFTLFGDGGGRININTAAPYVIGILSEGIDQDMVDDIVTYREDEDNDLKNTLWYKDAIGTDVDIIDPSLITIKSSYFEILSRGYRDNLVAGIKAVVRRNGDKFKILSWKVF
jgi:general secretion pathway protein K